MRTKSNIVYMQSKIDSLRKLIIYISLLIIVIILCGIYYNRNDAKYTKSRNPNCINHGILNLNEEDSHICCNSSVHLSSWICIASYDNINKILSSSYAFIIPLIPFLINICCNFHHNFSSNIKRFIFYLLLFLIRTLFLYKIPYAIQNALYSSANPALCWCKDFISSTKCKLIFDFSDHIVLSMVQYILPCIYEIHFSLNYEKHSEVNSNINNKNSFNYKRYFAIIVALAIIILNLRSILFTTMFFHTGLENISGFLICVILVYLPLYHNLSTSLWIKEAIH